jgi:hypothetical protein
MRIVINLPDSEGNRDVEDDDKIRPANKSIIRAIEDICTKHLIRYTEIYVKDAVFVRGEEKK